MSYPGGPNAIIIMREGAKESQSQNWDDRNKDCGDGGRQGTVQLLALKTEEGAMSQETQGSARS